MKAAHQRHAPPVLGDAVAEGFTGAMVLIEGHADLAIMGAVLADARAVQNARGSSCRRYERGQDGIPTSGLTRKTVVRTVVPLSPAMLRNIPRDVPAASRPIGGR